MSAEQVLFLDTFDFSEWKKIGIITLQVDSYQAGVQRCRYHAAANGGEAVSEYKVLNQQSGVHNIVTPTTTTQTTSGSSNQYASQMAADLQKQTGTSQSMQMNLNNNTVSTYSSGGGSTSIPYTILDVQCSVLARVDEPQPIAEAKVRTTEDEANIELRPQGKQWYCILDQESSSPQCYRARKECLDEANRLRSTLPEPKKQPCKPQKHSYCFTFRADSAGSDQFACSSDSDVCQASRDAMLEDLDAEGISNCSEW